MEQRWQCVKASKCKIGRDNSPLLCDGKFFIGVSICVEVRCLPEFQRDRCSQKIHQPSQRCAHGGRNQNLPRRQRPWERQSNLERTRGSDESVEIRNRRGFRGLRYISMVLERACVYGRVSWEETLRLDPYILWNRSFSLEEPNRLFYQSFWGSWAEVWCWDGDKVEKGCGYSCKHIWLGFQNQVPFQSVYVVWYLILEHSSVCLLGLV